MPISAPPPTDDESYNSDEEEEDWEIKTVSHKGSTIKAEDEEYCGFGIKTKVVDAESGPDNDMDFKNMNEDASSLFKYFLYLLDQGKPYCTLLRDSI